MMNAGGGRCSVRDWQFAGGMLSEEIWSSIDEQGSKRLSGGPP